MMDLDLILTIDTAAAHLAGGPADVDAVAVGGGLALAERPPGQPMVSHDAAVCQPNKGDWHSVVAEVVEEFGKQS